MLFYLIRRFWFLGFGASCDGPVYPQACVVVRCFSRTSLFCCCCPGSSFCCNLNLGFGVCFFSFLVQKSVGLGVFSLVQEERERGGSADF